MMTQPRKRIFTFAAVLVLGLLMAPMNGVRASDENLLAFTSSGHVLGFRSDAFFVASRDHALRIEFVGANPVAPHAEEMTPTSEFSHGAPPLARVTYANLWNGITLAYDAPDMGIARSTYALAPFANPDQILLRYNAPITLNDGGALTIAFATGTMRESAPIAWQEINQQRIAVPVEFALRDSIVGFTVGEYNRAHTLVIDPSLTWNTFLGGSGLTDYGAAIALDSSKNVYVAGWSNGTWGSPLQAHTPGISDDAYVAKLNSGGVLQWNTFLGDSGNDIGNAITVDRSGVYVAGYSNATWGSPVEAYTSGYAGFAAKLDTDGVLLWNTFLGGSSSDAANGIAVDRSANVYVAGYSYGTWGALPVRDFTVNGSTTDGYVAKLDSSGVFQWNTFLGGSGDDSSLAIAVDGGTPASVSVTGHSGATWEAPVRGYASGWDAFVAKLDADGNLQWNTFLGGSGLHDEGTAIAVGGDKNVYVGGISNATWGSPVRAYTGSYDSFAARLDVDGNLQWNTFLGGSGDDGGKGIALDTAANVYMAGYSNVTWGSPVRAYTGGYDAFAAKLNSSGGLQWNAFLGGSADDLGKGIAVDPDRNTYVAGNAGSTWGAPLRAYSSGQDGFAAKLSCCFDLYLPLILR